MYGLNLKLVKRFVVISKPYWFSEEKWRARGLFALLLLLLVLETQFNVRFNEQSGEFTSALAARDAPRFFRAMRAFFALLVFAVPIFAFYYYVRDKLAIGWRRWLSCRFLGKYFDNRAYYHLLSRPEIDNPDQRIADDIAAFTQKSLSLSMMFASSWFQVLAFGRVLWGISQGLVLFLLFYAAAGTWIVFGVFGRRMVMLNVEQLHREADFRFGLVRVRENAESIALYRGEGPEQAEVRRRFDGLYANFQQLIGWALRLNLFQYAYAFLTIGLPSLLLAPRVLDGELEVGRVVQAAGAFAAILSALTVLVDNFETLSRFAAGVGRLDAIENSLAHGGRVTDSGRGRIASITSNCYRFQNVTLQTPGYERTLVRELSLAVPPGEGLMIVGASGGGKSSLLRAMAGLWDSGAGTLFHPPADQVLFVPQHAYMILGTLRDQLSYPNVDRNLSSAELQTVLDRVNLSQLPERCGGFDRALDFEKVLSVGERQRLAVARVLLARPRFALLDEATSALDRENEALLYAQLVAAGITLVSVSHHAALLKYHEQVLELGSDGGYRMHLAKSYVPNDAAVPESIR